MTRGAGMLPNQTALGDERDVVDKTREIEPTQGEGLG